LETNRLALCDELREEEVDYVRKNWLPKEAKIIRCYTKLYANLGVYGTSRTEGLHPVLKEELSPSTPLPLAIKRVAKAVTRVIKELAKAEQEGLTARPRTLDIKAFQLVIGKVTLQALNRISPEWDEAKKLVSEGAADYSTMGTMMRQGIDNLIEPGQCMCENPVRFGLPCRHNLMRSVRNGFAFPISLIHPRWWINGPQFEQDAGWRPRYFDETIDPASIEPTRFVEEEKNKIISSSMNMMALRDELDGDEEYKAQLDEEVIAAHKAIIEGIRGARETASGFAKRLPQRPATERWEPAKRLPTAAESAASVAKDREDKEERLRKAREADRKEEEARKEAVFRSHAAAKEQDEEAVFRSHAAAKEQDEILENTRTTRSATTIDDEDEEVTIDDLPEDLPPPSTAPAALGGRSKRARAGTVDYRALAGLSRTREEIERLNQEAESCSEGPAC
jgi:hypothetical protein